MIDWAICLLQLDLVDGPENLTVQSTDTIGLVETSPVTHSFVVDTTPPDFRVEFETVSPGRDTVVRMRLSCLGGTGTVTQNKLNCSQLLLSLSRDLFPLSESRLLA